MSVAKVYSKGQVTIPKAVREAVGIEIGDRIVVEARGDEVVLRRPRGVLEFEPPSVAIQSGWDEARAAARDDRAKHRGGNRSGR